MTAAEVERLAVLETKVDSIECRLESIETKIDTFLASTDKRYAAKWVERAISAAGGAVILSVLYYVLSHVGIK